MGRPSKKEIIANSAESGAKAKADELAKQVADDLANEECEYPIANDLQQEKAEGNPKALETDKKFKVYDHIVKVNGVFYEAGEKVPVNDE